MSLTNKAITLAYDATRDPGYYAKVSTMFWRNPNYSLNAKGVYTYLLTYATQYEQVTVGHALMCKELGISEKTLKKAIDELVLAELVSYKRRGQGNTNLYKIYFIPLINSFGDNGDQTLYASRSRTARKKAESESKINKNDSYPFKSKDKAIRGPINFSRYLPGGKYGALMAPTGG